MSIRLLGIALGSTLVLSLFYSMVHFVDKTPNSDTSTKSAGNELTNSADQLETSNSTDTEAALASTKTVTTNESPAALESNTQTTSDIQPPTIPDSLPVTSIRHNTISSLANPSTETRGNVDLFWGPFNTQSRAESFANYIQQLTEVPMQTIQKEHGYSIGFKFKDEQERLSVREHITLKTGLKLEKL